MPKPMKTMPKKLAAMERAVDWEMGAMFGTCLRADYSQLILSYQPRPYIPVLRLFRGRIW
jgi:hypothetical protein